MGGTDAAVGSYLYDERAQLKHRVEKNQLD
jgi:hypothetical protein